MDKDSLNTALLAVIAAAMLLLVWRDVSMPRLTAAEIALAVTDPSKCLNPAVKPAQLEP